MNSITFAILLACAVVAGPVRPQARAANSQADLKRVFEQYTGVQLVFDRADLPPGQYYDIMPRLTDSEQLRAARIAITEAKKYPAGYLKGIGLKYIGIFRACAAKEGDGYRLYDPTLQGYRYYGIWNGRDALAAAYYSDRQLPLTLHHEIFHHIDARSGDTNRFADAVTGRHPFPAPELPGDVLANLRSASRGSILEDVVSEYCRKNAAEDKAETARYLMSHLADSLVQVASQPALPGSQRILHVLSAYEHAQPAPKMGIDWFVDIARGRHAAESTTAINSESTAIPSDSLKAISAKAEPQNPYLKNVDAAISDKSVRKAIRSAQPACVRLDNASGVNLAPDGYILTAAHVAKRLGETLTARLPDGRVFPAKCVAIDHFLDLAVLRADIDSRLPFASLARRPPVVGTRVICIGQPGSRTPSGKPTHYKPFTVSTGRIRGVAADPVGDQSLGRISHDAWTYWGHSGSPLLDENGHIVAMHNSWDLNTSMRHAVPYEAIMHFLDREHIPYSAGS
jgi:S1-C subfamily serine protease